MRFAIQTAERAWEDLWKELRVLARTSKADRDREIVAAVTYVWAFVDSVDRLRGLLKSKPGLGKRPPVEVKKFLAATDDLHELRNHAQHLPPRIPRTVAKRQPLWGTLKWVAWRGRRVRKCASCSLVAGTMFADKSGGFTIGGLLPDGPDAEPVELTVAGCSARLDMAWAEVKELTGFLEAFLEAAYSTLAPDEDRTSPDIVFRAELNPKGLEDMWTEGSGGTITVDLGSA